MHVNSKFMVFSSAILLAFAAIAEVTTSRPANYSSSPITPRISPEYRSQVIPRRDFTKPEQLFNTKCDDFIDQNGVYGERGEMMKKEILGQGRSTNRTAHFFGSGSEIEGLNEYCPNFARLSDDEKLNFWIWTMTIVANFESGCNAEAGSPTPPNNPPHGETVGAFQTPRLEDGRAPGWRGPGCSEGEGYKTNDHQVPCAIEILGDGLSGDFHKGQPTFLTEKGNHWEVIMKTGRSNQVLKTERYFADFKPCGYNYVPRVNRAK